MKPNDTKSHSHAHHDHSHGHGHHHAPQSFNAAFAIAVIFNFAFTVFQATYALLANSMSLLADAMHNLGDVLGLLLAWGASWLLSIPARKRYSYGYKRTTIIAALMNALILVSTSAIIAYESIHKLLHPTAVNSIIVIIVASIGILINTSTALLFMKGAHDDLNIKGAFMHLVGDAIISFGVVVAAGLILLTHKAWIDPLVGLIIVMIILWSTWGLLRDSIRLMMDAIPHYIDNRGIEKYLENIPGVKAVHDLHIWGLSTKEVALTVHLVMPELKLTDEDYLKINSDLKKQYRVDHATIQVEEGSERFLCNRITEC